MRYFLTSLAVLLALCLAPVTAPAQSQVTTKVLATCGTASYTAGKMAYPTQDALGQACLNGGLAAATTGGCTPSGLTTAASTNATSVKASAGTFCGGIAINTTATVYYLRLYNLAAAPTCSSATGFVTTIPIPASATGAGTLLSFGTYGAAFTTGIAYCVTGGGSSTDNTNAATGVYLSYAYK